MDFLKKRAELGKGLQKHGSCPAVENTKLQKSMVAMAKRVEHPSALLGL